MSKKETEFDRIDRMKKLEREAEITKRKHASLDFDKQKKSAKSKMDKFPLRKNWTRESDFILEEEC